MRGSRDPGRVSDGSGLAIYTKPSQATARLCVECVRVCAMHPFYLQHWFPAGLFALHYSACLLYFSVLFYFLLCRFLPYFCFHALVESLY